MVDVTKILSKTFGKWYAGLGGLALAACILYVGGESLFVPGPIVNPESCQKAVSAPAADNKDAEGTLRITDIWPVSTTINRRICLAVAGVASTAATAQANADPAKSQVKLTLFLNGRRVDQLTFKARAMPDVQYIIYDLSVPADAASAGSALWRELLAGAGEFGVKELSVGLSRTASDNPEAEAAKALKLRVLYMPVFILGVVAMLLLALAFCVLAKHSSILRDNGTTDAGGAPVGTFSLGRTQMALWLVLTIAGFIFIWLTLGQFLNVITGSVLVLLGINGATGLAAIQLNNPAQATSTTRSFFADILNDGDGPKLQRIQVLAWTVILAIIFIWNAVANFVFVAFDTNLLLLMGIANTMYLGFKPMEKS
jgi:hypothetical protein